MSYRAGCIAWYTSTLPRVFVVYWHETSKEKVGDRSTLGDMLYFVIPLSPLCTPTFSLCHEEMLRFSCGFSSRQLWPGF